VLTKACSICRVTASPQTQRTAAQQQAHRCEKALSPYSIGAALGVFTTGVRNLGKTPSAAGKAGIINYCGHY